MRDNGKSGGGKGSFRPQTKLLLEDLLLLLGV